MSEKKNNWKKKKMYILIVNEVASWAEFVLLALHESTHPPHDIINMERKHILTTGYTTL